MTYQRRDVRSPIGARRTGDDGQGGDVNDLAFVEGDELLAQRIRRLLVTSIGDILHRPEEGAGIGAYQNEPPSPGSQLRLANQARRFLDSLSYVEDHRVRVTREGAAIVLNITVVIDGRELEIPEVRFA